jgi:uroporphyrinogen-III synthase
MTLGLILNTRPTFYQERFHDVFGELDWAIFDCPLTAPEPAAQFIPGPDAFDSVIFTSQIGVAIFAPDKRWFGKKVFAVGPGTAEAATKAGFKDVVQTGFDADDLKRHLANATFAKALYPSAEEVSADLSVDFPGRVERLVVYKMVPRPDLPQQILQPIQQGTHIVVPLFSRRAAVILGDLLKAAGISVSGAQITAIGISADVFAEGGAPWHRHMVAERPTLEALAAKADEAIKALST